MENLDTYKACGNNNEDKKLLKFEFKTSKKKRCLWFYLKSYSEFLAVAEE
jgi:hypothetical protein